MDYDEYSTDDETRKMRITEEIVGLEASRGTMRTPNKIQKKHKWKKLLIYCSNLKLIKN